MATGKRYFFAFTFFYLFQTPDRRKSLCNVIGGLLHSIVCNFEYKPIRVDTVEHDRYTCPTIWRMDTYDYFSLE